MQKRPIWSVGCRSVECANVVPSPNNLSLHKNLDHNSRQDMIMQRKPLNVLFQLKDQAAYKPSCQMFESGNYLKQKFFFISATKNGF
jgi:hypothetical protein